MQVLGGVMRECVTVGMMTTAFHESDMGKVGIGPRCVEDLRAISVTFGMSVAILSRCEGAHRVCSQSLIRA